jgi:XTP/dITP diphosphohydrolase
MNSEKVSLPEQLFLASNNSHKIKELQELLGNSSNILTPKDFPLYPEPDESGNSLEENAAIKAIAGFNFTGLPTLSDDSGLFVESLGGEPGVQSAYYGGKPSNSLNNIDKLLFELKEKSNRKAYFQTIIAWYDGKELLYFKGEIKGRIIQEVKGKTGFGYDPVFIPDGYETTFAEMSESEKNAISHRANALKEFSNYFTL